jgi:hypothetical protein
MEPRRRVRAARPCDGPGGVIRLCYARSRAPALCALGATPSPRVSALTCGRPPRRAMIDHGFGPTLAPRSSRDSPRRARGARVLPRRATCAASPGRRRGRRATSTRSRSPRRSRRRRRACGWRSPTWTPPSGPGPPPTRMRRGTTSVYTLRRLLDAPEPSAPTSPRWEGVDRAAMVVDLARPRRHHPEPRPLRPSSAAWPGWTTTPSAPDRGPWPRAGRVAAFPGRAAPASDAAAQKMRALATGEAPTAGIGGGEPVMDGRR